MLNRDKINKKVIVLDKINNFAVNDVLVLFRESNI